jgi:ubiquitin C-terminal hydrolase
MGFVFQNESTKYSLFAVIVHSGFAMFGHYTAFVRSTTGSSWFYADDNHVGPVSHYSAALFVGSSGKRETQDLPLIFSEFEMAFRYVP